MLFSLYIFFSVALQQDHAPNDSTVIETASSTPYLHPLTTYPHDRQQFNQSNQFVPQTQTVPYIQSALAFEPVHMWSHHHLQQQQLHQHFIAQHTYTPSLDQASLSTELHSISKPLRNATDNGYFYSGFERNGPHLGPHLATECSAAAPTYLSSSLDVSSEQNRQMSLQPEHVNYCDILPIITERNGHRSIDANSLSVDKTMPSQRERAVPLNGTERTIKIDDRKKKIPRPMNSFMIYAKRHRAQVHQLYPLCDNRTVSKILSDTWYTMDADKKRKYHDLALEMRREHFRLYPEFKWKSTPHEDGQSARTIQPSDASSVKPNAPPRQPSIDNGDSYDALAGSAYHEYRCLESPYTPITPYTAKSFSSIDSSCDDNKFKSLDAPNVSHPILRLAPTPAQLGRNKKRSKAHLSATGAGSKSNGHNNDGSTSGGDNFAITFNQSHFKQRFLDLPDFDFSNYRKSSEWDSSPTSPAITYNTTMRKRKGAKPPTAEHQQQQQHHHHQSAKRFIGNHFFGPDFNVNHFNGEF